MPASELQLWKGMLAQLRRAHPGVCRQWFEEIEPMGIAGGILWLRAHTVVHRDYLLRHCLEQFNDAAREVSHQLLSVRFLGPGENADLSAPDQASPNAAANGTPEPVRRAPPHDPLAHAAKTMTTVSDDGLVLNPDYAFENFVVGQSNRLAHAAAIAVANAPGRAYNPYFVHGGVGLGKTHLLQAICLKVRSANPSAVIHYTSCEGFISQYVQATQANERPRFQARYRDVDVLVVDDIHFLSSREGSQEEFFHTFNALYGNHKQLVISSDARPEDIPDLEERLISRFRWGLVVEVAAPTYETRIEILKSKARIRGVTLPDDAAQVIAARIDRNIRDLEGAISTVQAVADLDKRTIDADLVRHALGEAEAPPDGTVQIPAIIVCVTDFFGVKATDLQSRRRQRSIALPRQVCMYLARRHTRFSLEEIGGYFGGRDHTTVMHAVRTVEEKREQDEAFAGQIKALEERLRA